MQPKFCIARRRQSHRLTSGKSPGAAGLAERDGAVGAGVSLRIAVLAVEWYPDRVSGYARVVRESAQALARLGHEVTVFVPPGEGAPTTERLGSLRVERSLRRGLLPTTAADAVSAAAIMRRGAGRFDVVVSHLPSFVPGILIAERSARSATPLVSVFHGSLVRELALELAHERSRIRRAWRSSLLPVFALLERIAADASTTIVVLSEYSSRLVLERQRSARDRVVNAPGGVDTTRFRPAAKAAARVRLGIEHGTVLLLTVRRLEPRMGLPLLLEALTRMRRTSVELAIVGEGSLRSDLEHRAAELGVEQRVRFVGRVPDEDLVDWYSAADLFVLPTIALEGFGMATVESLACGTPVVGTPIGATPEILGELDSALLADELTPSSLAGAIDRGLELSTEPFRARCVRLAHERYSWDVTGRAWERAVVAAHLKARSSGEPVTCAYG